MDKQARQTKLSDVETVVVESRILRYLSVKHHNLFVLKYLKIYRQYSCQKNKNTRNICFIKVWEFVILVIRLV